MSKARSIWVYAAAYFICYAPYVALTKLLSSGLLVSGHRVAGAALLPMSTVASGVGMVAFITWRGWWKHADQRRAWGRSWPVPDRSTALSGVATAAVIATTTLSYSVSASVLLMMVLMRGGVLALAPLIDLASRRPVQPRSWLALGMSGVAVALGAGGAVSEHIDAAAITVVFIYLAGYAVRLRAMSAQAKSHDGRRAIRFFVQEQMVASPALAVFLGFAALLPTPWSTALRQGFTTTDATTLWILAIGLFSQGTGIFGALVLLDARENAFCVPLNRASSILAGLLAATVMGVAFDIPLPTTNELIAASLLVGALVILGWPTAKLTPTPTPTPVPGASGGAGHVACERSET